MSFGTSRLRVFPDRLDRFRVCIERIIFVEVLSEITPFVLGGRERKREDKTVVLNED